MSDVADFRKEKNELFGTTEESPLTPEQKKEFKSLNYYPETNKFVFKNLTIDKNINQEIISIKTSAGDTEPYKRIGRVEFEVEEVKQALYLYRSPEGGSIFLPFKDKTNAVETYHDGRYVEPEENADGSVNVDLNYAYNPYCAYNDNFRCPITPEENTLDVEILAGEKRYH